MCLFVDRTKEKAFRHLSLAVETGMDDVNRILTHDDLAFVRIQPEFDNFKKVDLDIL
ncbi:MAG: hypothetical protein IPG79_01330 [Saprospiraceae bacterium]|nr:hypothetical protein [Saprospiraceae bacterium]